MIYLLLGKGDYNYGCQVKISKKLLEKYPDMTFWKNYHPNFKIYNLSIFLTKQGNEELRKEYDMWQLTKPKEEIKLSFVPVVEVFRSETKRPKTLMELLDDE